MGVEFGLGDADLLGLGGGGALGGADVGPPLQQLGRNAHRRLEGRQGDRPLTQAGLQVDGRKALQRAKLVLALPQGDLQRGDAGLGRRERALLLVDVQGIDGPGVEAGLDDLQHVALQIGVFAGQLDPLLGLPHGDVILRRVGQQGDEHGVVVFHGAFQLGVGALHLAAVETPKVEFPGQVEAEAPGVDEAERIGDLAAGIAAAGVLRLRKELAFDDGELARACRMRVPYSFRLTFWL